VVFDADPLLVFSLVTAIPRTLIHDAVTGLIHLFTSQSGSGGKLAGVSGNVTSYSSLILEVLSMLGQRRQ
jgi:hypothetical protein